MYAADPIQFNQQSGECYVDYQNNMDVTWIINTTVNNKPVLIECNTDFADIYDYVKVYSLDAAGNVVGPPLITMDGNDTKTFSTMLPTGRAKVVFHTNDEMCSDYNNCVGLELYFDIDNTSVNTYTPGNSVVSGNALFTGNVGVGTLNPTKKVEIWDNSGGFTFSAANCTSTKEVSQTIDNAGYRLNIGSDLGNYKIALNSTDRLKILSAENFAVGSNSLNSITSGTSNTAIGGTALFKNTGGSANTAIGTIAMYSNTTGANNQAIGASALYYNTTGNNNSVVGSTSLLNNTTGSTNSALGYGSLLWNTTGSQNIGIGYNAGAYISNGSTGNATGSYSVFIGNSSKALADGQTNQIVLGYNAIGNGSNTVTLGNDNITGTFLKGKVGIGITSSITDALTIGGNTGNSWVGQSIKSYASNGGAYLDFYRHDNLKFVGITYEELTSSLILRSYKNTNGRVKIQTNLTDRLLVDENGFVGIGTNHPGTLLDIEQSSGNYQLRLGNNSGLGYNIGRNGTTGFMTFYGDQSGANGYSFGGVDRTFLTINNNGYVGIGIGAATPDALLTVNGTIHAKEVRISLDGLADYVFDANYNLKPLNEVEQYIKTNKHLDEMPSADTVSKNGLSMGEMQNKLLQKVEELTLYVIELQKTNNTQSSQINAQSAKIEELEKRMK
jgi:hypothetical protein